VAGVVGEHLEGGFDFSFVDGLHTNEQIVLDYQAVAACGGADAVHLFHDVHSWRMQDGFGKICDKWPGRGRILLGTTSGMGVLYPESRAGTLEPVLDAFTASEAALGVINRELDNRRHKRWRKTVRSLAKRKATLKRLFGQG